MARRSILLLYALCVMIVGCVALTPSAIKKFLDPDPRMTQALDKIEKKAVSTMSRTNISKECTAALTALVNSSNSQLILACKFEFSVVWDGNSRLNCIIFKITGGQSETILFDSEGSRVYLLRS